MPRPPSGGPAPPRAPGPSRAASNRVRPGGRHGGAARRVDLAGVAQALGHREQAGAPSPTSCPSPRSSSRGHRAPVFQARPRRRSGGRVVGQLGADLSRLPVDELRPSEDEVEGPAARGRRPGRAPSPVCRTRRRLGSQACRPARAPQATASRGPPRPGPECHHGAVPPVAPGQAGRPGPRRGGSTGSSPRRPRPAPAVRPSQLSDSASGTCLAKDAIRSGSPPAPPHARGSAAITAARRLEERRPGCCGSEPRRHERAGATAGSMCRGVRSVAMIWA